MNRSKKRTRKVNGDHCTTRNQQRLRRTMKTSSSISSSSSSYTAVPSVQTWMNTTPYVIVNSTKADSSKARKHSQESDLNTSNNLVPTRKARVCQTVKQRKSVRNNGSAELNRPSKLNNRTSNQLSCEKPSTSQNGLQILAAVATTMSFIDGSHLMSLSQNSLNCIGDIDNHDVRNEQYSDDDMEFQSPSNYYNSCNFSLNRNAAEVVDNRSPSGSDSLEEVVNCSKSYLSGNHDVLSTVFDRNGCYDNNGDGFDDISETGLDNNMRYSKAERPADQVQYNDASGANLDNMHRRRRTKVHPYYKIAFHSLLTPTSG